LPGTALFFYQGAYDRQIQLLAAPATLSGESREEFRLAGQIAAGQHNPSLLMKEIATPTTDYMVLGADAKAVSVVAKELSQLQGV
jgi:hypothetical protein